MKTPVYLDYAATTPVDPKVAALMSEHLTFDGVFGNAASRSHVYGWQAEEAVENARAEVAELLHAQPREIVWTSGATEANNLAIKGAVQAKLASTSKKLHVVTVKTEHKAVLDTCEHLSFWGVDVTYLLPQSDGRLALAELESALREETVLVSVMHVNNETGVINDVAAIGALCRERGILLHVDAAQSFGKLPINVKSMNIDLLAISAHKIYGPKGIGALYVRRDSATQLATQIHGGGHERGMRSGTLATHQIVGLGKAAELCRDQMEQEMVRIGELRDAFRNGLMTLEGVKINGSMDHRIASNLNLSFEGVDGETLLVALRDIAVSSGSACVSTSVEPSYVLQAMGVSRELAHASIRFSFGRFTTRDEVEFAVSRVILAITNLRKVSA